VKLTDILGFQAEGGREEPYLKAKIEETETKVRYKKY